MSYCLLRRLSRCNSTSLEQCISVIPPHINHKLSSCLQRLGVTHQFSTAAHITGTARASVGVASNSRSNALLLSLQGRATGCAISRIGNCRSFSATSGTFCKGSKSSSGKDAESSNRPTTKQLLDDSADPSVPPGPDGKRTVLYEQGPYPKSVNDDRSQAKYSYRPSISPDLTSIVLFPGQGTQFVGMGKELLEIPTVQDMYAAASEILGFDLKTASLEGPLNFLSRTQVQQPAILVASLAAVEKLRETNPSALENCVATAGFSVGEITALTFAGALSFEDAVRVIKVRAEGMQLASEMTAGGMMTVFFGADCPLGVCCNTAKEFCVRREINNAECKIASYLWPTCKVVAGSEEALQFLQENMKDFHIKKLKRLNVSGAFHTEHMRPGSEALKEVLRDMTIHTPNIPVHCNIDGRPYRNPEQIRRNLPKQILTSVKWEQTMHILYEREPGQLFPKTYECGPGKSLKSMLKMVNQKAVESMENITA